MKLRSTGNWAEDLGNFIDLCLKTLLVLVITTPILIGIIVYLLVTR